MKKPTTTFLGGALVSLIVIVVLLAQSQRANAGDLTAQQIKEKCEKYDEVASLIMLDHQLGEHPRDVINDHSNQELIKNDVVLRLVENASQYPRVSRLGRALQISEDFGQQIYIHCVRSFHE